MIINVPLNRIVPNPWNTRQGDPDPEYLASLAMDISVNGLLQPPAGRLKESWEESPRENKNYGSSVEEIERSLSALGNDLHVQLAFGHNRLAAYEILASQDAARNEKYEKSAYDLIPVDVHPWSNEQMALLAWSENEQRRDVTPIERALAIQKRIADFGWSQAEIAEKLGVSRPSVSNLLRLLKLPEDVQSALSGGQIPERVAMALVSLFDMPESIRQVAERTFDGPSEIVRRAIAGEFTSDNIRSSVDVIYGNYTYKLDEAEWTLDDKIDGSGVQSLTCRDCPLRLKDRNRCMDRDCYGLKKNLNRRHYLEQASSYIGIPVIEDMNTSQWEVTRFSMWHNKGKLETVLAAKCPNLRLIYEKSFPGDGDDDFPVNYPNARIVCGKREQYCTCVKGLEFAAETKADIGGTNGKGSAETTAEDLKELARTARRDKREANSEVKDVLKETAERIATGLVMKNRQTWKKMLKTIFGWNYEKFEGDTWDAQVVVGQEIAKRNVLNQFKGRAQLYSKVNELLKDCGLETIDMLQPETTEPEPSPVVDQLSGKTLAEIFETEPTDASD